MFQYTRTYLKSRVNAGIAGKIGILVDADATMNQAASDVVGELDLRSSRRKSELSSKLFDDITIFPCPEDTDAYSIIGIPAVQNSQSDQEIFLVSADEFTRQKNSVNGIFAVDYFNEVKTLLISLNVENDVEQVVSNMESLTADGGTWIGLSGGGNVAVDKTNFIKGAGSLSWDINNVSETMAGIQNTGMTAFDISTYVTNSGSAFVWAYLTDPTDITDFRIRFGQDVSNYYEMTVTSDQAGNSFTAGYNLLRFDLTSLIETGSVTNTAIVYTALYMTKATGKVSEEGYRFDYLVLKEGRAYDIKYQSKYPWVSSAGVWKSESTDDLDLLTADSDEFRLFRLKAIAYAAEEAKEFDIAEYMTKKYSIEADEYKLRNPSEVKVMTTEYYNFGTRGDGTAKVDSIT